MMSHIEIVNKALQIINSNKPIICPPVEYFNDEIWDSPEFIEKFIEILSLKINYKP